MAEKENLEERKIVTLENIAESLDVLDWVEDIDKETWGERIEWYLGLWKEKFIDDGKKPKK